MDTSYEWKSLWTISSVYSPPLLLAPTATSKIGPLIFNPSLHHHIFTLPSTPPQIPPYPALSLSRFLHKASAILPSTTTSISQQLASFDSNPQQFLLHNCLQLLTCPGTYSTLAFFPTGPNLDQLGFVTLSPVNSRLVVSGETQVLSLENGFIHRILKISVSSLADCNYTSGDFSDSIIGYLLVSTMNSIHYFKITIRIEHSKTIAPRLELIDHKSFKSSIVHSCWSPHIPEESLVLLETGDLYLFDLGTILGPTSPSQRLTGKKVKVPWKEYIDFDQGSWLCCDFSWHPRVLIIAHSTGVFLVDSRSENYHITPMLKLGTRHIATIDGFLAFSVVGPDRFYFTLATNHMLFLCDIRKHTVPVLRWAHNIANPSYLSVSRLSDLRSLSEDACYSWASEAGYGILLGSFWNCEFSLFCYGPCSDSSGLDSSSLYAWGLPSNIPLGTRECGCGSCLVKLDFAKDRLPVWINWQQKKDFVLGFEFLDATVSSYMFKCDNFGGFSVVTLTASGNLELHRYRASWDSSSISYKGHIEHLFDVEDSAYYETGEYEFKFKKVFQYLKLDWLDGYLNLDLNRILSINLCKNRDNNNGNNITRNPSFSSDFHEHICESLKEYVSGGSVNTNDVFKDVYLPTSIYEIALRSIWSNLPKNVLRLGFSTYSDLPNVPASLTNVPFEFLEVPCQQPHLPPFFFRVPSSRSSKWSEKHKPSNNLVGPVTPVPFLMAYHKTLMLEADSQPVNSEIDIECDRVMRVVDNNLVRPVDPITVSLADDNEDAFHSSSYLQHLGSYKTRAMMDGSDVEDEKHNNIVFRSGQKEDEEDFFDSGCLLKLRFKERETGIGEKEKGCYKLYKRQLSDFKQKFNCYQEYLNKSNINSWSEFVQ